MYLKYPRLVIFGFLILAIVGGLSIQKLQFSFDFKDFFPTGDPDLEFYNEFKERFDPDDNFMLVGLHRKEGVFEQAFLKKVHDFSLAARDISFSLSKVDESNWKLGENLTEQPEGGYLAKPILETQSLLQVEFPLKTPFTFTTIPAIHIDEPERYESDKARVLGDERLVNNFISPDAKTMVVILRTVDNIQQTPANKLVASLHSLLKEYDFEEYHLMGRANFQCELVKMQIWEFLLSAVVAIILVLIVMTLIFRRFWGVLISVSSIALGLLIFVGFLGVLGRDLDSMALLYPIIMIIVGTSDVIHVMSKYVDELQKGEAKMDAIRTTMREIGMSVFLTSFTTAIGFLSLMTSRLEPIRNFGLNAAFGVMIAYLTVIIFTTSVLTFFKKEQIIKFNVKKDGESNWHKIFDTVYNITLKKPGMVLLSFALLVAVCCIGITQITTNTKIEKVLPIGAQVTKDFKFFETNFSGFRPFQVAVMTQGNHTVDEFKVVQEIDKVEKYIRTYDAIRSTSSIVWLYKSLNQAFHGNRKAYFVLPESEEEFLKYQKLAFETSGNKGMGLMVSQDRKFARITARILDVGGDNIKAMTVKVKEYVNSNVDTSLVKFRQTGTGVIVDKNAVYVRDSLLQGLGLAVLVICVILTILYRNLKMMFLALVPNLLPLMVAGAILGFTGIPLEAGVAIVFAIIFGIAVDDTIHILGRYRLLKAKGLETEDAIKTTLRETGKAITLTTVILFFGFVILLFSSNPPAITIGLLISATLVSALLCDVFILPVLLRLFRIK